MKNRILVVAPDEFGFRQYADDLDFAMREAVQEGGAFEILKPIYYPRLESRDAVAALVQKVAQAGPDLLHIQHEFGFMGSKTPGRYRFPALVRQLRATCPGLKIVATAHTTITPDYRYPVQGRGAQAPLRAVANVALLPFLKKLWIQKSWGPLDGVIVHSRYQLPTIVASGCPRSATIPHYVPNRYGAAQGSTSDSSVPGVDEKLPVLLVFGYFTPEKAQDVVIRAMLHLKGKAFLVLGGGVRRGQDQSYFNHCQSLVRDLELEKSVLITGFLSWDQLDYLCKKAALVLLPFRETSGSGSLADLFSRGVPVLASDLRLNQEISERIPGAMAYFKSEDPEDCARQIKRLLENKEEMKQLGMAGLKYATEHDPQKMAGRHLDFYRAILSRGV